MDSKVKKNYIYQVVYQVINLLLSFLLSPYIARVLGPKGVGEYTYSYQIAYYFVLFSMLGLLNYGSRQIAQVRDDRKEMDYTFSSLYYFHLLLSVICTVFYFLFVKLKSGSQVFAYIQLLYVFSSCFDISWFYFGIEDFRTTVLASGIARILSCIGVFTLVKTPADTWLYCVFMAGGTLLSQLFLWLPLHKRVSFVKVEWKSIFVHFKPMLVLFIPAIAVSLYKSMDKIMLGAMAGSSQLGFYENAERFNNIPIVFITSLGTVMLPRMSNLAKNESDKMFGYIDRSMSFVLFFSNAFAFGMALISHVFAIVFWGSAFEESGRLISYLAITIPFIAFANVLRTQYLIPLHMDKIYLLSVLSGAIVNLTINWLLIPRQGAMGAVIGTIVAEIVVCVFQTIALWKELPIIIFMKRSIRYILSGVIMFISGWFICRNMKKNIWTLLFEIAFGAIVYLVVSIIWAKMKNEPIDLFKLLHK